MNTIVIPSLPVKKLRHLEVKILTQGPIAAKWCVGACTWEFGSGT